MRLRRAGPDEGDEISTVWLSSRAASVPQIPPPVHSEDEVRTWFAQVVLPTCEVWVADDGDEIVAVLVLDGEWIDQLYVLPSRTGQGIGAELMDLAKRRSPTRLRLWTFQANVGARRFYERHGFMETGATAGANEEGAPDVRYEWLPPQAVGAALRRDPSRKRPQGLP